MGLSQARHRDQTAGVADVIGDILESANIVIRKPSTATIVLGGGTPKNFINQASVQAEFYDDRVGGHKYAIQIVTDVPYYGGASGSSLEEAQSWGKLSLESEKVTVHADVTIALPILVSALETTSHEARSAASVPEFDPSGRILVDERPAARRQQVSGVKGSEPFSTDLATKGTELRTARTRALSPFGRELWKRALTPSSDDASCWRASNA